MLRRDAAGGEFEVELLKWPSNPGGLQLDGVVCTFRGVEKRAVGVDLGNRKPKPVVAELPCPLTEPYKAENLWRGLQRVARAIEANS